MVNQSVVNQSVVKQSVVKQSVVRRISAWGTGFPAGHLPGSPMWLGVKRQARRLPPQAARVREKVRCL